jgi:hypothetical protein
MSDMSLTEVTFTAAALIVALILLLFALVMTSK